MAKEVILSGPGVIKLVAHYMSEEHVAFVQKAFRLCDRSPQRSVSQVRRALHHPSYSSSRILAELQMDPHTVATGFYMMW